MKKWVVFVFVFALLAGAGGYAQVPESKPTTPTEESPAQLKATIIKLQQALLDQQKESAKLLGMVADLHEKVADLRRSALEAAIQRMPEDVKAALSPVEQKTVTPLAPTTPKE